MIAVTYTKIWDFGTREETDEQSDVIFAKALF